MRPLGRSRSGHEVRTRAAAVVAAVLALAACDPVLVTGEQPSPTPGAAPPRRGAPPDGLPATLGGILARTDDTAVTWQDDPRPVEVAVDLAGGRPVRAVVTYVAVDSDRFLEVRVDDDAVGEDRPTLDAVGLLPVSAAGIEGLPAPGEDLLDPVPLAAAAAPAVADCGGGEPAAVTYDTGAPYGWDGAAWASEPEWGATVAAVTDDGARTGARVDPTTGTPAPAGADPCFTLPPRG